MNKTLIQAAFVFAFGTVALGTQAATLYPYTTLTITTGVNTYDANGNFANVSSGSWFAMDTNSSNTISGTEKNALSQGTTGLVIGVTTPPGASHPGPPTPGDSNQITAPWYYFGGTGSDYVTTPVTGDTTNGLNMSGWTVTWNGTVVVNFSSGAWGTGFSNGIGNIAWDGVDGHAYTLDFHAAVPFNDPSGFGGIKYALHLEGCVLGTPESVCTPVPEASTYAMMLAGLGLVGFAARRHRQKSSRLS
jgi:hypothetical protein